MSFLAKTKVAIINILKLHYSRQTHTVNVVEHLAAKEPNWSPQEFSGDQKRLLQNNSRYAICDEVTNNS